MRDTLKEMGEERKTFKGTFVRVGSKPGYNYSPEPTFLLADITDLDGNYIADHLWLNQTQGFKKLGFLNVGDVIAFEGRCKKYGKNFRYDEDDICRPHKFDYGIARPTKFKILSRAEKKEPQQ